MSTAQAASAALTGLFLIAGTVMTILGHPVAGPFFLGLAAFGWFSLLGMVVSDANARRPERS